VGCAKTQAGHQKSNSGQRRCSVRDLIVGTEPSSKRKGTKDVLKEKVVGKLGGQYLGTRGIKLTRRVISNNKLTDSKAPPNRSKFRDESDRLLE